MCEFDERPGNSGGEGNEEFWEFDELRQLWERIGVDQSANQLISFRLKILTSEEFTVAGTLFFSLQQMLESRCSEERLR